MKSQFIRNFSGFTGLYSFYIYLKHTYFVTGIDRIVILYKVLLIDAFYPLLRIGSKFTAILRPMG
jgi:hypothetical protein